MIYCKLIEGQLIFAPHKINLSKDTVVYNPTNQQLESQGWKQLITTIPPQTEDGYHIEANYIESDDYILQNWVVEKDSEELEDTELISILLGE